MRGMFFAAAAALVSQAGAQAPSPTILNETKLQAVLKDGATCIVFPLDSALDHAVQASLSGEWIDIQDHVLSSAHREVTLAPGHTDVELPLPLPVSSIWLRLRYSLAPGRADARAFTPRQGILALSSIAAHAFELKVTHAGLGLGGRTFAVHVQAVNPVTHAAVPGVQFDASLTLNHQEYPPSRTTALAEGFVEFAFDLPPPSADGPGVEAQVEISAELGDFSTSVSSMINLPNLPSARLQTDKPIYQPGQTIRVRALIKNSAGQAFEGAKVKLQIQDAEGERAHGAELVSSRFGIVQDDWTLPDSASLGAYQITLAMDGEDQVIGQHAVRVSRYELPEFSVTAKPDRSAYLPGQAVSVTISGTYVFGKPVPHGKVRVVRSGEDNWNPVTRKFETSEPVVAEGDAGTDGNFVARLEVAADHHTLISDSNQRFADLHFAAYYTDPSSERTEQRRFDVRLTREPIHVYLTWSQAGGPLPVPIYVSTDYADGRPAETSVELRYQGHLVQLRTNRYGVGKAYLDLADEAGGEIAARATDSSGATGTWTERIWSVNTAYLRVETERTFYRTGDSVTVRIAAPQGNGSSIEGVMVQAICDDAPVASRVVRLVDGKAEITFPYQSEFRRTVLFVAWNGADTRSVYDSRFRGARAVVFPDSSDLRITARAEKTVYRPGDKAALQMQVSSPDGRPLEAALGLAVVDQAVLERARTDSEFGQRPWFACAYCGDAGEVEIGGVRLNDLYSWKSSRPIPAGLDLVTEALSARASAAIWTESSEALGSVPGFRQIAPQLEQVRAALDRHYMNTLEFPQDESSLADALGAQWLALRDPWGMSYAARFRVTGMYRIVELVSAGPDKRYGTADDFAIGSFQKAYFAPLQSLIRQILREQEDYPADEAGFRQLLADNGLLVDSLRDPWGTPYRVTVRTQGRLRSVAFESSGPDRTPDTVDDLVVGSFAGAYFRRESALLAAALARAPAPPQSIEQFRAILDRAGIDISQYRDTWGRPYRLASAISSRYGDRINTTTRQVFGAAPAPHTEVTPVTQKFITFSLRSAGPDGVENTYDDFDIFTYPVLLAEESEAAQKTSAPGAGVLPGTGTIAGSVVDPSQAVIPDAKAVLIDGAQSTYEASTDSEGVFRFAGVPAGTYTLRVTSPGFQVYELAQIPVVAGKTVSLEVVLQVGSVSEAVTVEAAGVALQTASAEVSRAGPTATPRVREYFPETLLWVPELVTDEHGRASAQFTLADSVTTWKVALIASTLDGRVAETETDLRAFQPFFLDFSPPPILTEGDRLELPVTIRNYLDRAQAVSVQWQANAWSTLAGSDVRHVAVPADTSANVSFTVQAGKAIDAGKLRVSASALRSRDAIEKSVRVHPDGQELTQIFADLVFGSASFPVSFPANAIPGATRAELRLYPNMASMLLESAETLLAEPHGCAEQTISAAYANLVALRFLRAAGIRNPRIEKKAVTHIRAAVESLAGFEAARGGLSYWPAGAPDIAVSAHALSLLADAATVLPVDKDDLLPLVQWLRKQQQGDGRWASENNNTELAVRQSLLLTALVTRSLAGARKAGVAVPTEMLTAAYHHLARFTDATDEPYMLAQFVLAALDSGDEALLGNAARRLAGLAREERGGVYWDLRTNSPFYGWGTAGRFETTGLAVAALSGWRSRHPEASDLDSAIRRGLVFVLRGRDASGGWYSTQSTLRVMQALADAAPVLGSIGGSGGKIEIRVNGQVVRTVSMPDSASTLDPVLVDLSGFLKAANNRVDITAAGIQVSLVRLTAVNWLPWAQTQPRQSADLRFSVGFDRPEVNAGQLVHCSVQAERVGFRGYGMLLAEIGLPPGAEVDRASLERLLEDSSVDRYDVLPDRVILYLWPTAGGVSLNFDLRARIPMVAKSARSVLYDYYNPEALSEVAPVLWTVR